MIRNNLKLVATMALAMGVMSFDQGSIGCVCSDRRSGSCGFARDGSAGARKAESCSRTVACDAQIMPVVPVKKVP